MQPRQFGDIARGQAARCLHRKQGARQRLQALRDGKLEEAEKQLKKHAPAPGHRTCCICKVLSASKQMAGRKDLEKPRRSIKQRPDFAALGTALSNQGKYEEAIVPLEKSLQLNAGGWETHWTLAKAYYYNKRYDEALKTSQEALVESHGKAPEIELLVAQSLSVVGRYEDSAQALREFLKTTPIIPGWTAKLAGAIELRRENPSNQSVPLRQSNVPKTGLSHSTPGGIRPACLSQRAELDKSRRIVLRVDGAKGARWSRDINRHVCTVKPSSPQEEGMVEDVGHLAIEARTDALRDLGRLGETKIDVPAVVTANEATAIPAICSDIRNAEVGLDGSGIGESIVSPACGEPCKSCR
jgi:tetratricopeptide (TPR) repeat protein